MVKLQFSKVEKESLNGKGKCEYKWRWANTVKLVLSREVREPYEENGKKKFGVHYEDVEFVFPKEYSKMLRPAFSGDYDFDVKEENGTFTFTLKPNPNLIHVNLDKTGKQQA